MAGDHIHGGRRLFLPRGGSGQQSPWQPFVDIYRTRGGWLIKCDLAGVRPEDVTVGVEGSRVIVRGTRHDWVLAEGCCHYRLEISYSHFERTIELPENLEQAPIATEYREGMLLIRIGKEAP